MIYLPGREKNSPVQTGWRPIKFTGFTAELTSLIDIVEVSKFCKFVRMMRIFYFFLVSLTRLIAVKICFIFLKTIFFYYYFSKSYEFWKFTSFTANWRQLIDIVEEIKKLDVAFHVFCMTYYFWKRIFVTWWYSIEKYLAHFPC